MKKSLLISEADNIAALLENDRVVEFFVNRGELLLGDVYTATVENILPGIDAAFVNLGKDKMGFLHANDVPGQGVLKEKLVPKQKLLVQITKEPTGHKGPRVSTAISLPGRFLVLVPEERGVSISRRISEAKERARLKSVVNLMKPPGVGLIIRTEAKGQGEQELFEDFEQLWDRWQTIVSDGEASIGPTLIYRDQDLLFRVIRDAYSNDVQEIIVDSPEGQKRALDYMQGWASRNTKVLQHVGEEPLLLARGIDREIESALSDRAELPSGGHLNIQPTEALTVIDVNSGRFTSSRTQAETVRRTNLEAAQEIPRQLRLRNIGGMVIVDFIDMDSRRDQQQVLEQFQRALEDDRAKPQIGQLSDLGLVELTRRRQGQSLRELFTQHCSQCTGLGVVPTLELGFGDQRRVLSFKSREDDPVLKGRRGRGGASAGRQQSTVLKAATASGGRIKPIVAPEVEPDVEEDEEFSAVPEEILEQVPEELLEHQRAFGKTAHVDLGDEGGDDDDAPDAHFGEESREAAFTRGPLYAESADSFEDDDEDEAPVARGGRNEASRRPGPPQRFAEVQFENDEDEDEDEQLDEVALTPVDIVEPSGGYSQAAESPADSFEEEEPEEVEELPPVELPPSPFETEFDASTGVYRLKPRSVSDESAPAEEQAAITVEPHAHWHQEQAVDTAQSIELSANAHEQLTFTEALEPPQGDDTQPAPNAAEWWQQQHTPTTNEEEQPEPEHAHHDHD
jgi:Rne/Rng family ribonuclease